jgi:hypothetical protein
MQPGATEQKAGAHATPTVAGDGRRGLVLEGGAPGGMPLTSGGALEDPEGFWGLLERAVDLGAKPVGARRLP